MVELEKIPISKLSDGVRIAYEDDTELFEKYHIVKGGYLECVDCTMNLIREMDRLKPMTCYFILFKGILIGYMCAYEDVLYSYGVNIAYRRKKILSLWWSAVENEMGGYFRTFLYSNNERARKFLERNGLKTVNESNNILTLIKI